MLTHTPPPGVLRVPDTPTSRWAQHWGAAGEDGMRVVAPPSPHPHTE